AVSERLPRVRADRGSLSQAVLNLLASAIDQTPAGGKVVLSANQADDGSVQVHVRDSAMAPSDPAERFVVFRDGDASASFRSSLGLALTRSLLAVNGCTLTLDPTGSAGTLMIVSIPAELAVTRTDMPGFRR